MIIGLIKEGKLPRDRRAVLTPHQCKTLLNDKEWTAASHGLNLHGGVDGWVVDAISMQKVVEHLKKNETEFDLGEW